jgi:hypothetical protein
MVYANFWAPVTCETHFTPFFEMLCFTGPDRFESIASKVHHFLFMCGSLAHALAHHFLQGDSAKQGKVLQRAKTEQMDQYFLPFGAPVQGL